MRMLVASRGTGVNVPVIAACAGLVAGLSFLASPDAHAASPDASAASTPVPPVSAPVGLSPPATAPSQPDGFTAYVGQTSCDPVAKPGVAAFRDAVVARYPATEDWGISRSCEGSGTSEHLEGRAWDWHADARNPAQYAAAADLLNWLLATGPDGKPAYNARRVGLEYVMYNRAIYGLYRAGDGWRAITNGDNHIDHVHFSFSWEGAYKRTSFWTGRVAAIDYGPCRIYTGQPAPIYSSRARAAGPCPATAAVPAGMARGALLWIGSAGSEVAALQQRLGVSPATGSFGFSTQQAVISYQQSVGLPVTGVYDAATRTAVQGGAIVAPGPVLRLGSRGREVKAVQRALRVKPVTGVFGPQTKKAVKRFQRRNHLPASGMVDSATRQLLYSRGVLTRP